uniref:Sushi, von Willebrand factor type A, EGF and pentraxin domain-containing protein 1 n=1 Tax=Daphnia galeata TaxID=27404 RepID=A0A8J2RYL2_9CRUS|nr:unnamed protein product [Daphnia galeata]
MTHYTNRQRLVVLLTLGWIAMIPVIGGLQCGPPPAPLNAKMVLGGSDQISDDPNQLHVIAASVTYVCDPGFELIGNPTINCGSDGRWQGDMPICATNVALRKSANQSSTARGGSALNAIDGDRSTFHDVGGTGGRCAETSKEASPWWMADLMRPTAVNAVRVTTRTCCDYKLHDLEIRVGNNTNAQRNPLCAWFPGSVGDAETKLFQCAKVLIGQFVFVQMVGVESSLSLCEVEVFSAGADIPRESCTDSAALDKVVAFNRTCYDLQLNEGNTFAKARGSCIKQRGDLWNNVARSTLELITRELERKKHTMKSPMIWVGAQKEASFTSRTWRWVTGNVVERPPWGREQPNNYNGEQNCVVLDGGRDWLWNDVGCNLDQIHWICKFPPLSCGHPDRRINSTVVGKNYSMGATVEYRCPTGSVTLGATTRSCQTNGLWSDESPTCKHVDCGPLKGIKDGELVIIDGRTTFGASVKYTCAENYTLVGASKRSCATEGNWDPEEPKCLYGRCPELPPFERGSVTVAGLNANDTATYSCDLGHKLVGAKTITCRLGGVWSATPPKCQFVDCGPAPEPSHGSVWLVNSSTTFSSQATYTCESDYRLQGRNTRLCQEDGNWSSSLPTCKLIECEEPDIPAGSYVTGTDFTIHREIRYYCEKGHLMSGDSRRKCLRSGTWSDSAPTCTYVDCGALTEIANGQIAYTNGTTHLGSEVFYNCAQNYRLEGSSPSRTCMEDGKWSGIAPQCREIRCPMPERPDGVVLSISSSDRLRAVTLLRNTDRGETSSSSTFRIGSNVIYKCERGFRLDGRNSRVCDESGQWTGEVAVCTYVDCGSPEETTHGTVSLPGNTTYLSSYAQYVCEPNYKLEGFERRMCLENGSWSGSPPNCKEITCAAPAAADDSGVLVTVSSSTVGSQAVYSCQEGRRLVGLMTRKCLVSGLWEGGQPDCEWVDCNQPEEVENGRVFLVNGSTIFGSVAEYHCLPSFQRAGHFSRKCGADGRWAGLIPLCIEEGKAIPPLQDNGLDSLSAGRQSSGSGVWIGVGAGIVLVLIVVIALFYCKMKRGSWIWAAPNDKQNGSSGNNKKPTVTMMPPNIPLPPTPQTQFTSPVGHQSSTYSHHQQMQTLPVSLNGNSLYSSTNDIYEQLPGENHHMYDLTYEDTASTRKNRAIQPLPVSNGSPPPSPLPGVTVNGVTVNGFVMA